MGVWYCTRESVKGALDIKETARNNRQIDDAIESASREVEGFLHRKFYPQLATRTLDWPDENQRGVRPWRLWLNADELVTVTSLTSGGTVISASDFFLRPDTGPPFTYVEIDLDSSAAFRSGDTHQRSIQIVGVFGYNEDLESVGTLTASLAASEGATASTSFTTSRIGVGDMLKIDSEYMIVSERTMVDSTQNLATAMTASVADDLVDVTDGTAFAIDEVLQIDTERMLITSIAGNNLTVKRAWDGTVLAAHNSGADVYGLTGVELDRAELGTTLAAHNNGATISRHRVPGLIQTLCRAEAISTLQNEQAAYARTVGSGENEVEASGKGLADIRKQARTRYGRKGRLAAV